MFLATQDLSDNSDSDGKRQDTSNVIHQNNIEHSAKNNFKEFRKQQIKWKNLLSNKNYYGT